MSHLLYLRGEPGSGKHTIGQLVAQRLRWPYLWFHDLYRLDRPDPVVIARTVLPRLADHLGTGKPLVFSRPSRLASTVEMTAVLAAHCGYAMTVVRLTAAPEVLLARVKARQAYSWRVSDAGGLDEYLKDGGPEDYPGELILDTSKDTAEGTARRMATLIQRVEDFAEAYGGGAFSG